MIILHLILLSFQLAALVSQLSEVNSNTNLGTERLRRDDLRLSLLLAHRSLQQ